MVWPERLSRSVKQRWLLAPSGRKLGRVWVTVVFAGLTVAGVLLVAVVGIRSAHQQADLAHQAETAAGATLLLREAIKALQDERGVAELWLARPRPEVLVEYEGSQRATDQAIERVREGWRRNRALIDGAGPPQLTDFDRGMAPLADLRGAVASFEEESVVAAYSSVVDVALSATRRMEVISSSSPLAADVRALVRTLEAGEALARQRDVVVEILIDERPISQDELVRLLLLQQEARTNLASIRTLGVPGLATAVSEFLVMLSAGAANEMLTTLRAVEQEVDLEAWYLVATERLEALRHIGDDLAAGLAAAARGSVESADALRTRRMLGLSALLAVALVAGAAAVASARSQARALDEHGDLASGLFEWFLPERVAEVEGVKVAARYDAASAYTRAGGDWYDVYQVTDGRVALTVGDVAGHGAAATAQMAQARNLLRGIALVEGRSPASQVTILDDTLRGSGTMVTVFHGLLDVENGEFVYSRAGHLAGLMRTGDAVRELGGALGAPVGLESGSSYSDAVVTLSSGSQLVLFTDGLVEERGADLETALTALTELLLSAGGDVDEVADTLIGARRSRLDDAALLVVSWGALGALHDPPAAEPPVR